MLRPAIGSLVLLVAVAASPALAQSGANVLLVANGNSADSLRIAEHYARVRAVPQDQVLRIKVDAASDEVERTAYEQDIQAPIINWLSTHFAQDRILYIVLTKGVPLRIRGTSGRNGTTASVDSELAILYRRLAGTRTPILGSVANPYYLGDGDVAQAKRFTHADYDIFLVTRLDGYTVADVLGLIDRGVAPSRDGRILLDEKAGLRDAGGDAWLKAAADWLKGHGFGERVTLEETTKAASGEKNLLGYYSWGSNDPSITERHLGLGFVPGAIAGAFVSSDGRTFREPPATWKTGSWNNRAAFFAGSPQSLAADLIRDGVTGVAAHVAEPFLDATIRPNILFPAYLSGFTLAEAFYLAMPYVSWETVVVGDPLCTPFTRKVLQPSEIDPGLDPDTELPALLSARRVKALSVEGSKPAAVKAMLRSEARLAKRDTAGAQKALEEATALDGRLNGAHLLLATAYEEQQRYDQAIDRYRKVLANNPRDPIALNNLAYSLAVRKNQPAEALEYAEKAYLVAPSATVADTLAWVQHLLGKDQEAGRLLGVAIKQVPDNGEIRLHAAVVYAALGMLDEASTELREALRLDPSLSSRSEVKQVRGKTGSK